MAIGTQKLNDYTAAGGTAMTRTQELTNAWHDYQDALANNVDIGNVKSFLTEGRLRRGAINVQIAFTDP